MMARRVAAGRGWEWMVEGWRLFMKSPGLWTAMLLIYLGIVIVLSFIPWVGALASTLITPALSGGMLYGAAALARDEKLDIAYLFRAFQDQERLGPMLTLGAFSLAGSIIIILVIAGFVASAALGGGHMAGVDDTGVMDMALGIVLFVSLIILLIATVLAMAMFYGVPLVMLEGVTPWQAVKDSVMACLENVMPLLVFSLVYLVLIFLALIPLGLGFLIVGPMTFGAMYASYRDVFSDEPQGQAPVAPPPL